MYNVLLVDSPHGDATLLVGALRVEGYHVVLATTAQDAREALATSPMTLAIVDLMLRTDRGTNGLELARELKVAYPAMRVMLTSAYYLSERQLERADCGVSGFIPKPYDVVEVVNFIRAKISGPPSSRRPWGSEEVSRVVHTSRAVGDARSTPSPSPTVSARVRR